MRYIIYNEYKYKYNMGEEYYDWEKSNTSGGRVIRVGEE